MSSVIILSSPPETFARSPTPVEPSSPLLSPQVLLNSQFSKRTPQRFKSANVHRDGFSGSISGAGSLLCAKIGAENIPIRSPKNKRAGPKALSPKRFRSIATATKAGDVGRLGCEVENEDPIHDEAADIVPGSSPNVPASLRSLKRLNGVSADGLAVGLDTSKLESSLKAVEKQPRTKKIACDLFELSSSSPITEEEISHDGEGGIPRARQGFSPLNIDVAVARRMDWTPTKDPMNDGDDVPLASLNRSFSAGLIGSFGYNGSPAVITPASRHDVDTAPTKRRRIEKVQSNASNSASDMPPPKETGVKKPRAPPKKALTITGLATSNYLSKDYEADQPTVLDRFLSTQVRDTDIGHADTSSAIVKVKAAKKQRASRKTVQKSTLVSPASAIKALENQDAFFGSASQLARDESPSLIRETLEAIKQSNSYSFSSPIRTQDTEHISIESTTPRVITGVSRFARSRGLWSAAGRDEDNALLHIDTVDVDSFNTPDLRQAFPGKDVLVQLSASRARISKSPDKQSPSLHRGDSLHLYGNNFWDIDEMKTPVAPTSAIGLPKVQARGLHTAARAESPRKRAFTPIIHEANPSSEMRKVKSTKIVKKRTPKKPAFAGLTTEKLQKQIAAYGFKTMKKREQMIAVLEKCWEQKHAQSEVGSAAQQEPFTEDVDDSLKHGDYLSNVHSLANRPVPKEKKVPKPRKPKEPKEVKAGKKTEPKAAKGKDPAEPKVIRKRKSKATLSVEKVVDADILVDATHASVLTEKITTIAKEAIEKTTAKKTASKPKIKPKPIASRAKRTATEAFPSSSAPVSLLGTSKDATISSSSSSSATSMDAQIERAIISCEAPVSTNHQKEPTWHEKILLYDPIVLEDLAAWLNTVGLGAIGEDREVSALEVREWCEKRGICCLWRGGWRGNKGTKE